MEWITFKNPAEFRDRAFPFLCRNEAENGLGIGIVESLVKMPDEFPGAALWGLLDGGEVVAAAWLTPPHPLGLTQMPDEAFGLLVEELSKFDDLPPGVVGPKQAANRFCQLWAARRGTKVKSSMEQRIYQITQVSMPFEVPGFMRVAEESDLKLVEDWGFKFDRDCGLGHLPERTKEATARAVQDKRRYLWIADGQPVSMAGWARKTPNGITVNAVYTPDELRGRGYATAVVAALSQKLLDEGRKFCCLYTDLANPTSNSIYQKIGYKPVCDSTFHTFESTGLD